MTLAPRLRDRFSDVLGERRGADCAERDVREALGALGGLYSLRLDGGLEVISDRELGESRLASGALLIANGCALAYRNHREECSALLAGIPAPRDQRERLLASALPPHAPGSALREDAQMLYLALNELDGGPSRARVNLLLAVCERCADTDGEQIVRDALIGCLHHASDSACSLLQTLPREPARAALLGALCEYITPGEGRPYPKRAEAADSALGRLLPAGYRGEDVAEQQREQDLLGAAITAALTDDPRFLARVLRALLTALGRASDPLPASLERWLPALERWFAEPTRELTEHERLLVATLYARGLL